MRHIGLITIFALGLGGPAAAQELPDGPGRDATQRLCSTCHTLATVTRHPHSLAEWNDVLNRMLDKGLMASDEQLDEVAAYLARNYGVPQAAKAPAQAPSKPAGAGASPGR